MAKNWTPEGAARKIREHIEDGFAANVDEAIRQHPELEVGRQLFQQGSARPASHGSGAVAPQRPVL